MNNLLFVSCCFQHGRVKVRSSEEKLAAERKEKAEKVRVYREVTSKIFTKVMHPIVT